MSSPGGAGGVKLKNAALTLFTSVSLVSGRHITEGLPTKAGGEPAERPKHLDTLSAALL